MNGETQPRRRKSTCFALKDPAVAACFFFIYPAADAQFVLHASKRTDDADGRCVRATAVVRPFFQRLAWICPCPAF